MFGNNSPVNSKADFLELIHVTARSGLCDTKSQFCKNHSAEDIQFMTSQCVLYDEKEGKKIPVSMQVLKILGTLESPACLHVLISRSRPH